LPCLAVDEVVDTFKLHGRAHMLSAAGCEVFEI